MALIEIFVVFVTLCLSQVVGEPLWTSIPLKGLPEVDPNQDTYSYLPLRVGGQVIDHLLSLSGANVYVGSQECAYCPGTVLYDETRSDTIGEILGVLETRARNMKGRFTTEKVEFAQGISSDQTLMTIIDELHTNSTIKFRGGLISLASASGTFVMTQPDNQTSYQGLFRDIYDAGNMLNPVVGIQFGGEGTGKIDIGHIDPDAYEGEMVWVRQPDAERDWDYPMALPIDEIRGPGDGVINGTQDILAYIEPMLSDIFLAPDIYEDLVNQSAEVSEFADMQPYSGAILPCDSNFTFTPVINGVAFSLAEDHKWYGVNSQEGNCSIAMRRSSIYDTGSGPGNSPLASFGAMFLRSVYMAFRFATGDCPGYIGIAQKANVGVNLTTTATGTMREPPSDDVYNTCLNFKEATGSAANTKLDTTAIPQGYRGASDDELSENTFVSYKGSGDSHTLLNAEELLSEAPRLQQSNVSDDDGFWGIFS